MPRRQFETVLVLASLLAVSCRAGHAAEVLQQLPPDALGFAVIRDIGATDGKLQQLTAALQLRTLGPLEFLRTATGIDEGLDLHGEFMLAVIPSEESRGQMKFCVWLPTTDYERLLASLGTKPAEGITAVTIAGEDLARCVARQVGRRDGPRSARANGTHAFFGDTSADRQFPLGKNRSTRMMSPLSPFQVECSSYKASSWQTSRSSHKAMRPMSATICLVTPRVITAICRQFRQAMNTPQPALLQTSAAR